MKKLLFILIAAITVASCSKQQKSETPKEAPKDGKGLFLVSIKNANEWSEFNNPSSANFKKKQPSVQRQVPDGTGNIVIDMNTVVSAYDSAGFRWHNATVVINSVGAGYKVINVNSIHRPTSGNGFWRSGYWWLDYYRCTNWSQTIPNTPYSVLMPVAVEEEWFGSVTVMNLTTCQEFTAGEYWTGQ